VTAAYASTDYRSQGQTIGHVLVDIASPQTGGLNLFNLYVAAIQEEGDRLRMLDVQTSEWWRGIQVRIHRKLS
ncbi:hypothetical protein K503DRAFT_810855, partial [Rhizopogon vinicolor AM-OR11-026]